MRPRLPLKRGIELAAMVDIVFLLVAYFLIHASLNQEAVLEVSLPKTRDAQTAKVEGLRLVISKDKGWKLDGKTVDPKELEAVLRRALDKAPKRELRLYGDKDVRYTEITQALEQIQKAGVTNLKLMTRAAP